MAAVDLQGLFRDGLSVEYHYKNKEWKNGSIIACDADGIDIKIRKKIRSYQSIWISKAKAVELY